MTTLAELLRTRGLQPAGMIAIRNTLHPEDASHDFSSIDDVVDADAIAMYDRMQDGPRIGDGAVVLSFAALSEGRARLTGFRTFAMRPPGNVPGDIVYDYNAAHLLHSFIARAVTPIFYDAADRNGLDDLFSKLIVRWPLPLTLNLRAASDAGICVLAP